LADLIRVFDHVVGCDQPISHEKVYRVGPRFVATVIRLSAVINVVNLRPTRQESTASRCLVSSRLGIPDGTYGLQGT